MKRPTALTAKNITASLRRNPRECPACGGKTLKVKTDLLENLVREEDILTKHCSCRECGFAWEESYDIKLHEAIPKDVIYRQIGPKKMGIA